MQKVEIASRMTLKRMEPYNDTDHAHLEDMLDNITTGIEPTNLKAQILPTFNQLFPLALNDSLNHETFGENVSYSYHSESHGEMQMNLLHQVHGFGVSPDEGYRLVFVSLIDGFAEPTCNLSVPVSPSSYTYPSHYP